MAVSLQLSTAASLPPIHTLLLPWMSPKPEPAIVTSAPAASPLGITLVICPQQQSPQITAIITTPNKCLFIAMPVMLQNPSGKPWRPADPDRSEEHTSEL